MTPIVLLANLALSFAALAALCLSMNRHHAAAFTAKPSRRTMLGLRAAGWAGIALCFALVTASFGVLVAAFGKTPEVARKMAMFATLLMVMVGGAWVPSFMFPAWLQQASLAMPTRWAVEGFDAVTWRGMDMGAVLPAMGAQLGFALLFAALAVWRFRKMEG